MIRAELARSTFSGITEWTRMARQIMVPVRTSTDLDKKHRDVFSSSSTSHRI
jgi:hypothetical protein